MRSPFYIVLTIILFLVLKISPAQTSLSDSLKNALKSAAHDTTRCKILSELIELDETDTIWPVYNEQLRKLSEENSIKSSGNVKTVYLKYNGLALSNAGYWYMQKGEISKAYDYYYQALKIQKEINNKEGIATALINLGYLYRQDGNVAKAIDAYHSALKLLLEIGDKSASATCYNNIGFIFDSQGEYSKALEYYNKSLAMYTAINDKEGVAICYGNIGFIYETNGDPSCTGSKKECDSLGYCKAFDYLNKAIKIQEEINDKFSLANSLNILGGIYDYFGDPFCKLSKEECIKYNREKALECYLRALKLRKEIKSTQGMTQSYNSLAEHMLKYNKLNEALVYGTNAMETARELGSPEKIRDAAKVLKEVYEKQNKFRESLVMYQLYIQMHDSIENEETKKVTIKKGFQIEYEKQAAKDSLENAAKIQEEKYKHGLAITQQRYYTYGGLIGFGLMLLVATISFRAFKTKQKSIRLISRQKKEVEAQKHIIEQQKHIVDDKQKEILESITYAKRIQEAILPPKDFINKHLEDYFVLYKPKDIVAGDFYWAEKVNDLFFIAAADSTGHGVPGAMVSVVCSNALNRSVKEFRIAETGKILDKTRELVLETFEKSADEVKDGMDISLLCINNKTKEIFWSGANNPLWYIHNNEFKDITADKQPIGKTDYPKPFTTHKIDFKEGTTLYLFTDGFADQFGGNKGKKYKYKQLSELLLRNNHLQQSEKKELLNKEFETWKGSLEQVDDVCIIGIKI